MTRRKSPASEWRECPQCAYPMLRAEKLDGISDQVSVPDLGSSWLPALLYEVPLALLASALAAGAMIGVALLFSFVVKESAVLGAFLLGIESLLLWRLRLWTGWKKLLTAWFTVAASHHDNWQGSSIWTMRRTSSRGGAGGVSFILGMALFLGAFFFLIVPLSRSHDLLADVSILVAGLLGFSLLPALLDLGVAGRASMRRQKRLRLMRKLAPDDWVCPNCLHAEKA